jgi:hypothetical protein
MARLMIVLVIVLGSVFGVSAQDDALPAACDPEGAVTVISELTAETDLEPLAILQAINEAVDEALADCEPEAEPVDATLIPTDETHFEREMGCALVFDVSRGSASLQFLITGEMRDDIFVDVFLPGEDEPLDVLGQNDKQFIDSEDLYIQQYYSSSSGWPLGTYRILLEYGDETRNLAFEMERAGEYNIYVYCE